MTITLTAQLKNFELLVKYEPAPSTFWFALEVWEYIYGTTCEQLGVCAISGADIDDDAFLASAEADELCAACPRQRAPIDAGVTSAGGTVDGCVAITDADAQRIICREISLVAHNGWHDQDRRDLFLAVKWQRGPC